MLIITRQNIIIIGNNIDNNIGNNIGNINNYNYKMTFLYHYKKVFEYLFYY